MDRMMIPLYGPSILFCPGDRPERFAKAAAAADTAVLDLEDGVMPASKDAARDAVCAHIAGGDRHVIVRINDPATERGQADLKSLAEAGARSILMAKTETTSQIDQVVAAIGKSVSLTITVESAAGLQALPQLLRHDAVSAVSWGPYDLAADLGMRAVRDASGALLPILTQARNQILLAAGAARVPVYDTVTAELSDGGQILERDANEAALLGFVGKYMIHPSQTEIVRNAFRPTEQELDRSRRMLEAITDRGAFLFEGDMTDEPMLRRARRIVETADRIGTISP